MANQKYQVPAMPAGDPGTGPRFDTDRINDGVDDIHRDKILIAQAGSLNVVGVVNTSPTASDYGLVTRPASHPPNATTTGTIAANGGSVLLALAGHNTAYVKLSGTWVGTIQFQGSIDGVGWDAITASRLDGSIAANWTANQAYRVPVAGLASLRVISTAWTSGTATVDIGAGYGSVAVAPANAFPITDNSGTLTVDAPVGTPLYARLSDGTAALTTTGGRLSVDASGVAVPVTDNAGSLTVDAPVATPAYVRLSDGAAALVGQKAMTASIPVTMASDQASHPVSVSAALPAGTNNLGTVNVQGTAIAQVSGTVTTSTSVVGGATDYSNVNNVTATISGTYAGVNVIFEGSDDAGTTWFAISGQREDSVSAENSSGVLPTNASRAWVFSLLGYNRFRVRATAFTSGTANVRISTASMPFEPVVAAVTNKPSTYVACDFGTVVAGVTGVTAEALLSLTPVRDGAAGGAGTAFSPTAGKTFRATSLSVAVVNGAATQNGLRVYLRINPAGTATATSPIHGMVGISAPNAVSGGMTGINIPLDIDIKPSWSFGLTQIAAIASGSMHAHLIGYEY